MARRRTTALFAAIIVVSGIAVDPWGWDRYGPLRSTLGLAMVAAGVSGGTIRLRDRPWFERWGLLLLLLGGLVSTIGSPDLLHATASGGVVTNVSGRVDVANAYDDILAAVTSASHDARIDGVRVERYTPGFEVMITAFAHERFGPMVGVGTGGAAAEAAADLVLALAPIDRKQAIRLIERSGVLHRAGDAEPSAIELARALIALGEMVSHGGFAEVEINPIAWTGVDWIALDAVVRQCEPSNNAT